MIGFHDTGITAVDRSNLGSVRPRWGTGGGPRITLDPSFVIRADVGVSRFQDGSPGVYISLGNLF